jgi:hypothetical protein
VNALQMIAERLRSYDSPEGAQEFLRSLGYPTIEPLPQKLEELPEGARELVSTVVQIVHIEDSSLLRIFHVELAGSETRRTDIRRFLEAYYRRFPQGENLFVFSPKGRYDELAFVAPRRLPDPRHPYKVRLWLRTLPVRREQPYRTDLEVLGGIDAHGARTAEELWKRMEDAFSVQRVTEQFFQDYGTVFQATRRYLRMKHQGNGPEWARDYTHQLLNRLMFLYFIARKGWLPGPNGAPDRDFLRHFWEAYREARDSGRVPPDTFHSEWLPVLFFEAFNNRWQNRHEYRQRFPEWLIHALAQAPYLNGGLYRRTDLDEKLKEPLPDVFFEFLFERWVDDTFPGLFERYNFTVVETGRFDEEVAVDPEMLGVVYERLVNVTFEAGDEAEDLRGAAGIFYTPRTEIDLMCRLALVDWLANHLGAQHKDLLYQWVFAFSEEECRQADESIAREGLWDEISECLRRARVCDPACGSGSFLVGMLRVLDDLQTRCNAVLGIDETPYERRKRILQDQLYGVDVMEWAVRVAELRLWLQLVVETDLKWWELKARPLLPNLTFKLRPGDSLLQTLGDYDLSPFRRSELPLPAHLKGRITQIKGKKRRFFLGEDGGLSEAMLKKEEMDLFRDTLRAKDHELSGRIAQKRGELEGRSAAAPLPLPGMEAEDREPEARRRLEAEIRELEEQRKRIQVALDALQPESPPPFVWDLAFAEIFEDEDPGFDIVIGNPPYVRQEKIRDYLGRFDRQQYLERLNESLRAIYPTFLGKTRYITGRADVYIYFYLHGLSLLADKGTFCFITSNSWLDVDFGKDLQEFFLRHGDLKMVLDNRARRSFAQADVNTVIVLAGPPERKRHLSEDQMKSHAVRFVAFRVPFEEALSPVVFSEIEDDRLYSPMAHFRVLQRPEYRAVRLDAWTLWQEGLDEEDGKGQAQLLSSGRYAGDKWGGKYLRAPDIFFTILEKGQRYAALRHDGEVLIVEDVTDLLSEDPTNNG